MESGWKFDEIDRMDMLGFLRIRAWSAKRERKRKNPVESLSTRFGLI